MATYPKKYPGFQNNGSARPTHYSGAHNNSSQLDRSFGNHSAAGSRDINYKETFFREGFGGRSPSVESSQFLEGKKNQRYVNPTYQSSFNFLHFPDSKPTRAARPATANANYNQQPPKLTTSDALTVSQLAQKPVQSSVVENQPELSMIYPTLPKERDQTATLEPQVPGAVAENYSTTEQPSQIEERQSNLRAQSYINEAQNTSPLRTTFQSSFSRPHEKSTAGEDLNDFLVSPAKANKRLMEQKIRQSQEDRDLEKKLIEDAALGNSRNNVQKYQEDSQRKEALRSMLKHNIEVLKEKEKTYKRMLKEDLSSMVDTNQKAKLRDYLDQNKVQKNMVDRMTDSSNTWNYRSNIQRDQTNVYNQAKGEGDYTVKKDQLKSSDKRQDRIEKIGQPHIYSRNTAGPLGVSGEESFSTPSRYQRRESYSSTKSGVKEPLDAEALVYQKALTKSYNQPNPEVQRRNEDKLRELRLREAYKHLSETTQNKKIPYSSVSKFLYDHSKSALNY